MNLRSFRVRVAVLTALLAAVVLSVFGGIAWTLVKRVTLESVDTRLDGFGRRLSARARPDFDWNFFRAAFAPPPGEQDNVVPLASFLHPESGEVLFQSDNWPASLPTTGYPAPSAEAIKAHLDAQPQPPPPPEGELSATLDPQPPPPRDGRSNRERDRRRRWRISRLDEPVTYHTRSANGEKWRVGVFKTSRITLLTAISMKSIEAETEGLRRAFLLSLPAALLLVGFGAWAVSRRAIRPINDLSEAAESITATGLDHRLEIPPSGDELARLTTVFNGMLNRLERSFRQANRFSADASHELKTPLAIMQGQIEEALRDSDPDSREHAAFVSLGQEVERLKEITAGLLLLSRADAGRLDLASEPVDFSAEVEALAEDAEVLGSKTGISVETDIAEGIHIEADRSLLNQALQNLLSNAIKYNQSDGRIRLELRRSTDASEAVLEIENTGPGIPADQQTKIFGRFQRGDSAHNREIDGLGLGLNLAQEIARAHGGSLELVSSDQNATRFRLLLPLVGTSASIKTP